MVDVETKLNATLARLVSRTTDAGETDEAATMTALDYLSGAIAWVEADGDRNAASRLTTLRAEVAHAGFPVVRAYLAGIDRSRFRALCVA